MIEIRPLQESDLPGIVSLVERAGFPARSAEGWHWALFQNPEQGDLPAGFCAVRNGELVSMIGLQARTFQVKGAPMSAICGHTFISSPEGRGAGFRIARRALALPGLKAIYSLNNNAAAGAFHKRIGLGAWLGDSARERLEWPVRPMTMAAGLVLSRLARKEAVYDWLSRREWLGAPRSSLAGHKLDRRDVRSLDPADIGDSALIDQFGRAVTETEGAAPLRTAAAYRFQMSDPDAPGRSALLASISDGRIDGLCQLVLSKPNTFEPVELVIADLALRPGAERADVFASLVDAAHELARKTGAARFRLPFSSRFSEQDLAKARRPLRRKSRYDSAHAMFRDEGEALARDWHPTGFESDFHFALRTVPSARAEIRPAPQQDFERTAREGKAPEACRGN